MIRCVKIFIPFEGDPPARKQVIAASLIFLLKNFNVPAILFALQQKRRIHKISAALILRT
jgi:hypothetical protein